MVLQTTRVTVAEFEQMASLAEHAEDRLEYIGGEIVHVVSNNYCSMIAGTILFSIRLHLRDSDLRGYVTGADGGYVVSGERYIPDVGYISQANQPDPSHETWNPNPPDLAVEVMSPTDSPKHLSIKIGNYLAAGTLLWVVYPDEQEVVIHAPGKPVRVLMAADTLDGGTVLPGFTLPVKDIFAQE